MYNAHPLLSQAQFGKKSARYIRRFTVNNVSVSRPCSKLPLLPFYWKRWSLISELSEFNNMGKRHFY